MKFEKHIQLDNSLHHQDIEHFHHPKKFLVIFHNQFHINFTINFISPGNHLTAFHQCRL